MELRSGGVVKIADLVDVSGFVRDVSIQRALIVGPAILLPMGSFTMVGCALGAPPEGLDALLWEIRPDRFSVVGAVGLVDCEFHGCEFRHIGWAGPRETLDRIVDGMTVEAPDA